MALLLVLTQPFLSATQGNSCKAQMVLMEKGSWVLLGTAGMAGARLRWGRACPGLGVMTGKDMQCNFGGGGTSFTAGW